MQGQGLGNTKVGRNNLWALKDLQTQEFPSPHRGQLHVAIDQHTGLALVLFHLIVYS